MNKRPLMAAARTKAAKPLTIKFCHPRAAYGPYLLPRASTTGDRLPPCRRRAAPSSATTAIVQQPAAQFRLRAMPTSMYQKPCTACFHLLVESDRVYRPFSPSRPDSFCGGGQGTKMKCLSSLTEPPRLHPPHKAAQTFPHLFDMLVALSATLAGTFCVLRSRGETIVGVAIATALMPPLAVVEFGLATRNTPVFLGSLELFATHLSPSADRDRSGAVLWLRQYAVGTPKPDEVVAADHRLHSARGGRLASPSARTGRGADREGGEIAPERAIQPPLTDRSARHRHHPRPAGGARRRDRVTCFPDQQNGAAHRDSGEARLSGQPAARPGFTCPGPTHLPLSAPRSSGPKRRPPRG